MRSSYTSNNNIDLDPAWIEKNASVLNGQSVALYARISGQASLDGISLDSQLAVNRRFALSCGAIVVAERAEVITGVTITARAKFNELLQMAEHGEIKVIIVDVRDRLGRGEAIAVLEFLARQSGAKIVFATQPADLETYEGVALEATDTLVSRIERLNIQRRTNRGRREWSSQGRIFTGRLYPYGYRLKVVRDQQGRLLERTFVIEEVEAEIVKRIFHWFVYEDLTAYAIAVRLEESGTPVPSGHEWQRQKTKNHWWSSMIVRILRNETYAGVWHYGKANLKSYEDGVRLRHTASAHPAEHHIAIPVPALISRELWLAAKDGLKHHSKGGHPPINQYLLRGRVKCTKSETSMVGQTVKTSNGTRYGYYVCPQRSPSLRLDRATRCDVSQLHQRRLEHWVWTALMKLGEKPETILVEAKQRKEEQEKEGRLIQNAAAALQSRISELKSQKAELLDLFLDKRNKGSLTRDEYDTKAQQIADQRAEVEEKLAKLQRRTQTRTISVDEAEQVVTLLRNVKLVYEQGTFEDKVELIRALDVHVNYDGTTIQLLGCIPTQTITLLELTARISIRRGISSPLPQCAPSNDSQPVVTGSSNLSDRTRSMGYMPD